MTEHINHLAYFLETLRQPVALKLLPRLPDSRARGLSCLPVDRLVVISVTVEIIAVDKLGNLTKIETRNKGFGWVKEVMEVTSDGTEGSLVDDAELRLMEIRRGFKCGVCVGQMGHEDGGGGEVCGGGVVGDTGGVEDLEGMIGGIGGVGL